MEINNLWISVQELLPRDLLSLSWYLAIFLVFCSLAWWKVFLPLDSEEEAERKKRSKTCGSPNCVRCVNYMFVRERLLERFHSLKNSSTWTKGKDADSQRRLENAVERYFPGRLPGVQLTPQHPTVFHFPGLGGKHWYDEAYEKELAVFKKESHLSKLKQEFEKVYSTCRHKWSLNIVPEGKWETFYFMNQGVIVEENLRLCPEAGTLLKEIKSLMRNCAFGNALFSVLHPHTHIEPHCGPTNVRIRCHVPLIVPEGCKLTVAGEERAWKEGELLLFDDSYLHEAWHTGCTEEKELRVVFMIDLWHPNLSQFERESLGYLFQLD